MPLCAAARVPPKQNGLLTEHNPHLGYRRTRARGLAARSSSAYRESISPFLRGRLAAWSVFTVNLSPSSNRYTLCKLVRKKKTSRWKKINKPWGLFPSLLLHLNNKLCSSVVCLLPIPFSFSFSPLLFSKPTLHENRPGSVSAGEFACSGVPVPSGDVLSSEFVR